MQSFGRFVLLSALALAWTGCGDPAQVSSDSGVAADTGHDGGRDAGDTGTVTHSDAGACVAPQFACGSGCCDENQACVDGACVCQPNCEGRECGDDGCGGDCGLCADGQACDAETSRCFDVCEPWSNADLCIRRGKACGDVVDLVDNCGTPRSFRCPDTCERPDVCDPATNRCICVGEPEGQLCDLAKANRSVECGSGTVIDACGEVRSFDCGDLCTAPDACIGNVCVCVGESDLQLCANHGKNCGAWQGVDVCGEARRVEDCSGGAGCAEGEACSLNVCGSAAAAPLNDDCPGAEMLTLVNNRVEFDVDTTNATGTGDGLCNTASAPDVVYAIDLPVVSSLHLESTLAPTAGDVRPNLYVRVDCLDKNSELGCVDTSNRNNVSLDVVSAGPGIVYLWVDGWASSVGKGPQHVTVQATPLVVPPNDECTTAETLPQIDGTVGTYNLSTSTVGAAASATSSTCALTGPDLFYAFTLTQDAGFHITASASYVGSKVALSALPDCGGPEATCVVASTAATSSTPSKAEIFIPLAAAGTTWILRVSDGTPIPHSQDLVIEVLPPVYNDTCATAETLQFDPVTHIATVDGNTTTAAADTLGTCYTTATGSKDVAYTFTVAPGEQRIVFASVRPAPGSNYRPYLYIVTDCANAAGTQMTGACQYSSVAGATASIAAFGLTEGTYFLIVDSYSTYAGAFSLTVEMPDNALPPPNDTCNVMSAPELVPDPVTRYVEVMGTTFGAVADMNPNCSSDATIASSGEVFYKFTVTGRTAVHLYSTPLTAGFLPTLYLLEADCDGTVAIASACGTSTGTAGASLAIYHMDPGTYYIAVDGKGATSGDFKLGMYVMPDIVNQVCSRAEQVTFGARPYTAHVVTDTLFGNTPENDVVSSCNASATGRDLVWEVHIPDGPVQTMTVSTTPFSNSAARPVIHARATCGDRATELACLVVPASSPGSVDVLKLRGGTSVFLWIDGWSASTVGPFSLDISLADASLAPNDRCEDGPAVTAKPLSFSASGVATEVGSTLLGMNDTVASCTPDSTGGDLVYSMDFATMTNVNVKVIPSTGSALIPSVYVRQGCGAPTNTACYFATTTGTVEFNVRRITGTWYIFVDSKLAKEGAFTLQVTAVDSGSPPANDECVGVQNIPLGDAPASATLFAQSTESATDSAYGHGSCATAAVPHDGPDVVYSLNIATPAILTGRVRADPSTPAFKPAIYLRKANCESAASVDEVGCGNEVSGFATFSAYVAPDTYYLFVDGTKTTSGLFTLDLSTVAVPDPVFPDTCALALDLGLEVDPGPRTIPGDTGLALHQTQSLKLSAGNGPDMVYSFTLTEGHRFKSALQFAAITGNAVLYLRKTNCMTTVAADEVAAAQTANGGPASIDARLDPGTYYLWVDSTTPLRGLFNLTVELGDLPAQPAATACQDVAAAAPLTFVNNLAVLNGTTVGSPVSNHAPSATCAAGGAPGSEAIYRIDLPQGGPYAITATVTRNGPVATAFSPLVYLRAACDDATSEAVCAGEISGVATATLRVPKRSTYYLFVDSATATSGDFTLAVSLSPATPDTCIDAAVLGFDASGHIAFAGNTSLGIDNINVNCTNPPTAPTGYSAASAGQTPGKDLAYKVTVPDTGEDRDLVVTLSFPSNTSYGAAILIKALADVDACPSGYDLCDRHTSGGKAFLRWSHVPAGAYLVWIDDGYSTEAAAFVATIDLLPTGTTPPTSGGTTLPPPPIVACANPPTLGLSSGFALFSGNTANTINQMHIRGVTSTGNETAFGVAAPVVGQRLIASVFPAQGSAYRGAIEFRTACDSLTTSPTSLSNYTSTLGPVFNYADTTQADYFLWADSYNATSIGPFNGIVTALDLSGPLGESCAAPIPMPAFDANGYSIIQGMIMGSSSQGTKIGLTNDETSDVCSSAGNDQVFTFTLANAGPVTIAVQSTAAGPESYVGFSAPTVYLRSGACDKTLGTELGCKAGANYQSRLAFDNLPAGQYWAVVDSTATSSYTRPFAVVVHATSTTTTPPAPDNDTCAGNIPTIQLDGLWRGSKTVPSGIEDAANDMGGKCATLAGPDLIYAVDLPANHSLQVTVSQLGTPLLGGFSPAVTIRSACDADPDNEMACTASTTLSAATATAKTLVAGRYYIVVDSTDPGAVGGFKIDVIAPPLPPLALNDDCSTPFPPAAELMFDNMRASVGGSLADAVNSGTGTCTTMSGPDKVYTFTLIQPQAVTATLVSIGFTTPALYLRSACSTQTTEPRGACASGTSGVASFYLQHLDAGTYYLWVDSTTAAASGDWWLDIDLDPAGPIPTGADCAAPIELDFTTNPNRATPSPVTFVLGNSAHATTGSCASMPGADWVYHLQTTAPQSLVVTSTGTTPSLYVRSNCSDTATELACKSASLKLMSASLPAGDYYVFVDYNSATTTGNYALTVNLGAPFVSPPLNETCANALPLSLGAMAYGETTNAVNDYTSPGCSTTANRAGGPDLVYTYTATGTVPFKVVLYGGPSYDSTLWIGTSCATSSCVVGVDSTTSAGDETARVAAPVDGQVYYIFVEGYGTATSTAKSGAFGIIVLADP